MIINRNSQWSFADVFPWANTREEARLSKRITVTDEGLVQYDGQYWTKSEFIEHMSKLFLGFTEAFILAAEAQTAIQMKQELVKEAELDQVDLSPAEHDAWPELKR